MEINLGKSHFVQGLIKIACEASIYSAWSETVEEDLRDETPKLAQILESPSFHEQVDSIAGERYVYQLFFYFI